MKNSGTDFQTAMELSVSDLIVQSTGKYKYIFKKVNVYFQE